MFSGEISPDDWLSRFEQACKARHYFGFGSHDCVFASDPEHYLSMYKRLLDLIRDRAIFTATFGEVADLFRRSAISDFYNQTASRWNRDTTRLYRTDRYKDIVTEEAASIANPVIADLGSAGGALSKHLADAQKIYCVDMAEGMLQDIAAENVQLVVGDVTDTNLEDQCADVVIAARVTEYVYEPALLLNEIKRIAKDNARVIATFPALADQPPSNEGDPPSRLRKHYSKLEVERFGQNLGTGRVLGIHYLGGTEPENEEDKTELLETVTTRVGPTEPADFNIILSRYRGNRDPKCTNLSTKALF